VQDAYIRWHRIGARARGVVENPRAWLSKATTRLCLDRLKSARAQRETYVGPLAAGTGDRAGGGG
jgi:RNA polymerase sigma-70 factor, ECF subfamily